MKTCEQKILERFPNIKPMQKQVLLAALQNGDRVSYSTLRSINKRLIPAAMALVDDGIMTAEIIDVAINKKTTFFHVVPEVFFKKNQLS